MRERRLPLRVTCKLRGPDGAPLQCESADVSKHGMKLRCPEAPALGAIIPLRVALPDGEVSLRAKVVHRDDPGDTVGLEFLTDEGYQAWCKWLAEWA